MDSLWDRVAFALDTSSWEEVERRLSLYPEVRILKVGYEYFYAFGWEGVEKLKERGYRIFLDLKLHDIPTTVRKALSVIEKREVDFLTLHLAIGRKGILEVVEGRKRGSLKLLGVTYLTHLSKEEVEEDSSRPFPESLRRMVTVAKECHLDGVVLSPQDLPLLSSIRKNFSRDGSFLFVTPGIRLPGTSTHDQNRFSTPFFAWKEGADLLVLGRTLLENDPDSAKKALLDEWERFLKEKL